MTSIFATQPISLSTNNLVTHMDGAPAKLRESHTHKPNLQRRPRMEAESKDRGRRTNRPNKKDGTDHTSPAEPDIDVDADAEGEGEVEGEEGVDGHSSGTEGPSRKRRRSRKGLDKKFECPQEGCGKSYSRAEHL
jgi:hypothetical protein